METGLTHVKIRGFAQDCSTPGTFLTIPQSLDQSFWFGMGLGQQKPWEGHLQLSAALPVCPSMCHDVKAGSTTVISQDSTHPTGLESF